MIYLASVSPRRRTLLKKAKIRFIAVRPFYKETRGSECSPARLTRRHALGKALSVAAKVRNGTVLAADTVVFFNGRIFGKPRDMRHAFRMLGTLSGHWHTVVTAVVLLEVRGSRVVRKTGFVEKTKVKLKGMDRKKMRRYFKRIRPLDKAGAYAFQSGGVPVVERIHGSPTNIVGLPMEKLKKNLDMLK